MSAPKLPGIPPLVPGPIDPMTEQERLAFAQSGARQRLVQIGAKAALEQMSAQVAGHHLLMNLNDDAVQTMVIGAATAAATIAMNLGDNIILGLSAKLAELQARLDKLEEPTFGVEELRAGLQAIRIACDDPDRFAREVAKTRRMVPLRPGESAPSYAGMQPNEGHRWETDDELRARLKQDEP